MPKFVVTLLIICLLFSCKESNNETIVSVMERQILVNNMPYLIKGICYHPVPKGSSHRSFQTLSQDLAIMQEAGINTIRVYAPIKEKRVLDDIHKAGIKLIIGFGYDQKGVFDIKSGTCIDYVNRYKNHPAILMWELGNEYNYHPEWFEGDLNNWYYAMNNTANLIHLNDSNHPVSTAHGDLPNTLALSLSTNIDVWGMNVYRMDKPDTIFPEWEAVSSKPMYLSETGADSYMAKPIMGYAVGENEKVQADANKIILEKAFNSQGICSGVTLFSFTDGWWKTGNTNIQDVGGWAPEGSGVPYDRVPNEEYWGVVDIDRNKKETFYVLKTKYNQLNN